MSETTTYTAKDFATDQDVRWCPGCGDYSILKQVQTIMPDLNVPREDIVFISGIGCSSRFPYYMNTYGMHSIHGRATSIATGLKTARPELSVWVVTGDGDGLSIGGNHLIHLLRRNLDVNILLFNNEIYGLTKGQYSPTSHAGQVTKSSPMGAIDHPFNPLALALGADATFVARTADRDPIHQREMLLRANAHKGSSFLEIYQNCNVFNDGAFEVFTGKDGKPFNTLYVEHGKPLVFANGTKGIVLEGHEPKVVELNEVSEDMLWVHDEHDSFKAYMLTRMFDDPANGFPRPFGVLYSVERPTYEDMLIAQIEHAKEIKGDGELDALLAGRNTWVVE